LVTRQEPFAEFDDFEELKKAVCEKNVRPLIPPNTPAGYTHIFILSFSPSLILFSKVILTTYS
jgi:hypothetical protein